MPIPPFNSNSVLPPHLGDPRRPDQLSPYPCTSVELCQRFNSTPERRAILDGFLQFRQRLTALGVRGFQWLDGSFLEDIETLESRAPGDLDVVTFYVEPNANFSLDVVKTLPEFIDNDLSKNNFLIDHFPVDIEFDGSFTVEATRYWSGLFSHRRNAIWKGMLRVELCTTVDDTAAAALLTPPPLASSTPPTPPVVAGSSTP